MENTTLLLKEDNEIAWIEVTGRFNFQIENEFDGLFDVIKNKKSVTFNFNDCEYIDSSGIRMLVRLAKARASNSERIKVINCNNIVKDVFSIANLSILLDVC